MRTVPGPTGTAAIFVDDGAENVIVVVPGANATVSAEQVRIGGGRDRAGGRGRGSAGDAGRGDAGGVPAGAGGGRADAARTRPAAEVPHELLALTDVCVPNETELQSLTGIGRGKRRGGGHGGRVCVGSGPEGGAASRGPKGALLVTAERGDG